MNDRIISILAFIGNFAVGLICGILIVPSKQDHTKDFVAQCQKSQFYFADGVGIQCPAVINNRVTKES